MKAETINWFETSERLPDDDTTVLLRMPDTLSEPVWPGYYCNGSWHLDGGAPAHKVIAWAPMPTGECRKCHGHGLVGGECEDGVFFDACPKCSP